MKYTHDLFFLVCPLQENGRKVRKMDEKSKNGKITGGHDRPQKWPRKDLLVATPVAKSGTRLTQL
jgi:hypothetical protein